MQRFEFKDMDAVISKIVTLEPENYYSWKDANFNFSSFSVIVQTELEYHELQPEYIQGLPRVTF